MTELKVLWGCITLSRKIDESSFGYINFLTFLIILKEIVGKLWTKFLKLKKIKNEITVDLFLKKWIKIWWFDIYTILSLFAV